MAKRQREWAKRAYDRLIIDLGGQCAKCRAVSGLQIDHIDGRDWQLEKVEWSARISIYRREAKEGLLQVLCAKCNQKKGDPRQRTFDEPDTVEIPQLDLFTYAAPVDGEDPF